ncbi:uncharacterized protein KIAA0232 homolog isoform X1 [Sorex fumeus]|uniref:uncharacterized protein KIAA0232 homolog isoform X1 n=2 Tax=Sorex fumeus TaxID=62283 RepID=UPI0024AD9005|nr:uncharacterized protein KIAA0232 homolog isoform X1 [Sorex fumeus]
MRPVCTITVDGSPSGGSPGSFPGSGPVSEMSLLHALGPVQTWLGQELEKCGIDAMIYTRYVLSLLLHDSYDYDLQEQEKDIFLGWEKGAYKKWGKRKKKCSDLTLEEMKKQAAVRCLRSASDESSGIETLVEELCSRLKDLQSKQEEKIHKKLEGSPSPEAELSPTAKDQVEMYYEAFPPLSEKPVCLQEIMTVWNKSKVSSYSSSSSSSTAPPASTGTSSPKDCNSEGEAARERGSAAPATTQEQARSRNERENKASGGTVEEKPAPYRKQGRHRAEGKVRPRSWSSGSSEAGSSSSGNQGEFKASTKCVKVRHKTREVRGKKGRHGQGRLPLAHGEKVERSLHAAGKRGQRLFKDAGRKDAGGSEGRDLPAESRSDREYKEEPLWYTEPIAEYFVPLSRKSKLETTYRSCPDSSDLAAEVAGGLSESVQGLRAGGHDAQPTYLAAGTFIDGHFVEMPALLNEDIALTGTSFCSLTEDDNYLDDIHLAELTHFYEVDIDQSMLDPGASETMQGESRILNMIRQKSKEKTDFEAECCIVLDGMEVQGERAIWTDRTSSVGAEGLFLQDLGNLAQFWECCSSSSGDADGESFGGDSPVRLSPVLDGAVLSPHLLAGNQELFADINEGSGINSCFSVFEVQCSNSVLPFSFETLNLGNENTDSSANMLGKTQSRLLIWTKNSAFEENEHCSNLSTRTCSPWSHSEETRSDNETLNIQFEESTQFNAEDINYVVPSVSSNYVDEELLDFLQDETCQQNSRTLGEIPTLVFKNRSKLESVCGIQLEQKTENKPFETTQVCHGGSPPGGGYSSGVIKEIWTKMADRNSVFEGDRERMGDELFPTDVNNCCCCLNAEVETEALQEPRRAVQRSEYRLWEGQRGTLEKRAFVSGELSKVDGGDYTTPSKPWDVAEEKESAFILGGVYGEFKPFHSDGEWALVPPGHTKGSLLQCAASDVVTIAGTDVFMAPGNSFAPGHRQLWKPFVSLEPNDPPKTTGGNGLNKGFSFIFHEDFLGACGNFQVEDPGLEYSFSSFDLSNPFSQVLHVECSFEPEGIASFSPSFKPKSILCSDSDSEVLHPRICGVDRTQYRAIRISPRTHFRPISASELSPGGGSESEFESEKEEANIPIPSQVDTFEDPQADLKPLEEDAEKEGHYYGKTELESGKFLPRLKKSGMEKSAQTSLDSQEESSGILLAGKQSPCLECSLNESLQTEVERSEANCKIMAQCEEEASHFCSCRAGCQFPAYEDNPVSSVQLGELPVLHTEELGAPRRPEKQSWWEKALYSPLFPASECEECCTNAKGENGLEELPDVKEMPSNEERLLDFNRVSSVCEARCTGDRRSGAKANGFRRRLCSSASSGSEDTASDGGAEWADPSGQLFSRTHL